MILSLWALALAARYLKYVPILGWRFSETIVQRIENRMDRDVDVADVSLDLADDHLPTDLVVDVELSNELPVDLSVTALNVRIAYANDRDTIANVCWSSDAHGTEPRNVNPAAIETESNERVSVEHYVPANAPDDVVHVDGALTLTAWLDVPSAKRIPLGDLERELPDASVECAPAS